MQRLDLRVCVFCGRELQASPPPSCSHTHTCAHLCVHTHSLVPLPRLPAAILSSAAAALWPGACGHAPSFPSLLIWSPKRYQAFPWRWWVSVSSTSPQGFLPPPLPKSPQAAGRHSPAGPCCGAEQAGFLPRLPLLQRDLGALDALPGR